MTRNLTLCEMVPQPYIYRARIVGDDDPQHRNRYRVFVYGLHLSWGSTTRIDNLEDWSGEFTGVQGDYFPADYDILELNELKDGGTPSTDYAALPWAEVAAPTGKHSGLSPVYVVGDLVWVVFEGGDPAYPVIVGGWVNNSFGLCDLPPEMSFDSGASYDDYYATGRRRWMQVDRRGNLLELSEVADENWVRARSGAAEHTVSSFDDGSWVRAYGFHRIEARSIFTRSQSLFAQTDSELILQVAGDPPGYMPGSTQPLLGLYSTYLMDIYAHDELAVGQYLSREITTTGDADTERVTWMQTRFMWAAPKVLLLGLCSRDMFAYYTNCPPDAVNLEADAGGVGPDAQGWNWYPTERVRMEATQDVVIRAGRDSRPGPAIDDAFVGMYATGWQEIWAKKRTWIGQYVNPRHHTVYRGDTVVVSPSRLVLGYSKLDDDCEPGVLTTGLGASQFAPGLPVEAEVTKYVDVWADLFIQLRINEVLAATPNVEEDLTTYTKLISGVGGNPYIRASVHHCDPTTRELALEDILIQGRTVIIQSGAFETPDGFKKGNEYTDDGGLRFCPGVLRVIGRTSVLLYNSETLHDVDSRFNELYFDDEDSTPLVVANRRLVDSNFRFRVTDKGGRALVSVAGPPILFPVKVTKDGYTSFPGDGSATTPASWTYTVTDLYAVQLGTQVPVTRPRPNGKMTYQADGGYGLAFYEGSGATAVLRLWDAGEVPTTAACT